ncbi:MAG TPA: hypothetical protein DCY13_23710, partial [Verrucomicrobiales bacterium]|nr:hypothetical protein [Verrucomicrobiales bacterium]
KAMTFPGDLNIGGLLRIANSAHVITVNGTLTLANTGTIDNAGTLNVGAFTDQGGTIIGNPPVVIGLAPAGLVSFKAIKMEEGIRLLAEGGAVREVLLIWQSPTAAGFQIEMSHDLRDWRPVWVSTRPSG